MESTWLDAVTLFESRVGPKLWPPPAGRMSAVTFSDGGGVPSPSSYRAEQKNEKKTESCLSPKSGPSRHPKLIPSFFFSLFGPKILFFRLFAQIALICLKTAEIRCQFERIVGETIFAISGTESSDAITTAATTDSLRDAKSPSASSAPTDDELNALQRVDRGRALRKSAAIEDEDHILSGPVTTTAPFASAPVAPSLAAVFAAASAHQQPLLNNQEVQAMAAALISQSGIKPEVTNEDILSLVSSNLQSKQPELFASNWMGLNNNALASLALMNTENLSTELLDDRKPLYDLGRNQLSTESNASTSSGGLPTQSSFGSLLSSQNSLGGLGTSASLSASASTSNDQIPRKQDIQNDIRHNKGRFELVRKRGRSEVWNLFGQVVDKQTKARLPYVACYACKVLYTDTGGGTGNMTRHRCSMGTSYRSSFTGSRSSLDTLGDTQSSSFDSVQAINGPGSPSDPSQQISPIFPYNFLTFRPFGHSKMPKRFLRFLCPKPLILLFYEAQQHSTSAAREAFAQSGGYHGVTGGSLGSSGYGSGQSYASLESITDTHRGFYRSSSAGNSSSSTLLHPLSAIPPLHRSGSASSSTLAPTLTLSTQTSRSQAATPTPIIPPPFKPTPTRPGSSLQTNSPSFRRALSPHPSVVVTGAGYMFTQADKQLFAQAVVQFCAQDMHNYDVVAGEGFKNLIETVLFIGRRSHGDMQVSNSFDPVRNLIPDAEQLREVFVSRDNAVRLATMSDLSAMKDVGLCLTCQSIFFGGSTYLCVTASYLTEEWQLTKRALKVEKCEGSPTAEDVVHLITTAMTENGIINARQILLSFDTDFDDNQELSGLPPNITVIKNIVRALNMILIECFKDCPDEKTVGEIIELCRDIVGILLERQLLLREMPAALSSLRLTGSDAQKLPDDYVVSIHLMVKFVKENLNQIQRIFEDDPDVKERIRKANWSRAHDIRLFLETFYDTVKEFGVHQEPMFQATVPECFALLHVCQESEDDDERKDEEKETSSWVSAMRQTAESQLRDWVRDHVGVEHYIATVLNPKLKQLPLMCTDLKRLNIYAQLREAAGLTKIQREVAEDETQLEGEPSRKRKNFLSKLEDCAMEDDEFEAYLRTPLSQITSKSVLEFWSSFGEKNFPLLARFTRFILGVQPASTPLRLRMPSSKIGADDINTLLKLRWALFDDTTSS